MDLQSAILFMIVWFVIGSIAIYLVAVVNANRKRKEEERRHSNNPIDIFWRNLKQLITKIIIYAISKVAYL